MLLGFESLLPKQVDKKYESRIRIHAKWQAPRCRCPLSSWQALKDTTRAAKFCASAGSLRPGSKDRHLHISPARSYNFYQWAMDGNGTYDSFSRILQHLQQAKQVLHSNCWDSRHLAVSCQNEPHSQKPELTAQTRVSI